MGAYDDVGVSLMIHLRWKFIKMHKPWERINALDAMVWLIIILDYYDSDAKWYFKYRTPRGIHDLQGLRSRVHRCFKAAARATGCTEASGIKCHRITQKFKYFDVKTNVPLGKRYEEHIMRIETCKEFKSRIEQDNIAIGLTSRKHDLPDLKKVKII
ncbi:17160_t:CDS:2 [Rhizophagus irregularis]|nr:17160_t:CDS:2 [Rhizophagus irregularis]